MEPSSSQGTPHHPTKKGATTTDGNLLGSASGPEKMESRMEIAMSTTVSLRSLEMGQSRDKAKNYTNWVQNLQTVSKMAKDIKNDVKIAHFSPYAPALLAVNQNLLVLVKGVENVLGEANDVGNEVVVPNIRLLSSRLEGLLKEVEVLEKSGIFPYDIQLKEHCDNLRRLLDSAVALMTI